MSCLSGYDLMQLTNLPRLSFECQILGLLEMNLVRCKQALSVHDELEAFISSHVILCHYSLNCSEDEESNTLNKASLYLARSTASNSKVKAGVVKRLDCEPLNSHVATYMFEQKHNGS
jgi:hypothetical protein